MMASRKAFILVSICLWGFSLATNSSIALSPNVTATSVVSQNATATASLNGSAMSATPSSGSNGSVPMSSSIQASPGSSNLSTSASATPIPGASAGSNSNATSNTPAVSTSSAGAMQNSASATPSPTSKSITPSPSSTVQVSASIDFNKWLSYCDEYCCKGWAKAYYIMNRTCSEMPVTRCKADSDGHLTVQNKTCPQCKDNKCLLSGEQDSGVAIEQPMKIFLITALMSVLAFIFV